MKMRDDFLTYPNGDRTVLVPVGRKAFSGVVKANKTTAYIFECLKEDVTEEEIVRKRPVFRENRADFGDGAERTLAAILELCTDKSKRYYLGGYSLAGLFALWAAYQTEVFRGVAAASPSMWFPGFVGYMKEHTLRCGAVYLSLGDREEKARNPVMATVGDRIREAHQVLKERGIPCRLEWNEGNHFRDADVRTAKGFAYLLNIGQS